MRRALNLLNSLTDSVRTEGDRTGRAPFNYFFRPRISPDSGRIAIYNDHIMSSRLFKYAMNSLPLAFLLATWLYSIALFLWIGLGMFSHFPSATDAHILLLFPILFAGTWVAMFVLEIIEPNGRRKEPSKGFEVLPPK